MTGERPGWREWILPAVIVGCLLVILVPVPPIVMDVLLVANIAAAVIILLTALFVRTPLEFSLFPTVLVTTTFMRLVLNVASTRLILSRGGEVPECAAGAVIDTFGRFVAGNELAVGLVIFAIIVIIQFAVITKGTTRVSEVAARFALDGMPGRQMAIDAELSSGAIDAAQAQARREQLIQQSDFYAAMDGAGKFVRGDAIAGLVITLVNLAGGMGRGLASGMSLPQAVGTFSTLTIGDGLSSQIPAFLSAIAAGLLVTRGSRPANVPLEFVKQPFARPHVPAITGVFLLLLLTTGFPAVPVLCIAAGCLAAAVAAARRDRHSPAPANESAPAGDGQMPIEQFLAIDPLEIELGVGLLKLADADQGGDLLDRITHVRKSLAAELGIVLPKVRIRDNLQLADHEYRFRINNVPVANGTVYPGKMYVVTGGKGGRETGGALNPDGGAAGTWIDATAARAARDDAARVVSATGVLASQFHCQAMRHAADLLTRDATANLIQQLRTTAPTTVDELVPRVLSLGQVQRVLQLLLREGVSIRPLTMILETLGDFAGNVKEPVALVEKVRQRMAATLSTRYRNAHGKLSILRLDPGIEKLISQHVEWAGSDLQVLLAPREQQAFRRTLRQHLDRWPRGSNPVLLVDSQIRPAVRRMVESDFPDLVVLGDREITRDTFVEEIPAAA